MIMFRYHTPDGFDDLLLRSDCDVLTGLWFEGTRKHGPNPVETFPETSLPPAIHDTIRWLDIYFSGRQPDFVPLYCIPNLTPFRKEVSEIMCEIPFGQTVTYGEIATQIAKAHGLNRMSAQAVGGAVGWNPICIIVPCHRVIGANGNLTGYGGGIHNKIALLRLEGHDANRFSCQNIPYFCGHKTKTIKTI